MPVVLDPDHFETWFDPDETRAAELLTLLTPHPVERMQRWPVSTRVNSPAEDDADLLTPVPEPL
jgi:putative SOS response-associated peptidase YedK